MNGRLIHILGTHSSNRCQTQTVVSCPGKKPSLGDNMRYVTLYHNSLRLNTIYICTFIPSDPKFYHILLFMQNAYDT